MLSIASTQRFTTRKNCFFAPIVVVAAVLGTVAPNVLAEEEQSRLGEVSKGGSATLPAGMLAAGAFLIPPALLRQPCSQAAWNKGEIGQSLQGQSTFDLVVARTCPLEQVVD
jgi:hypothetical protein